MPTGIPVWRGGAKRYSTSSDITNPSFTSVANEVVFALISVSGAGGLIPDSITGHAANGAWAQIGTTQATEGSGADSVSLWVARSGGETGSVTISRATAGVMTAAFVSVTGCSTAGSSLNAIVQSDENWDYGTNVVLALSPVFNTTIDFLEKDGASAFASVENTSLGTVDGNYATCHLNIAYAAAGDATPTATNPASTYWAAFSVELKPEGNIQFANVDGDNIVQTGQTTVAINLIEGGNNATAVKFKRNTLEVVQANLNIVNDTQITFDVVDGQMPFGNIKVVVTSGGSDYEWDIEFIPVTGNESVEIVDPLMDNPAFHSILDGAPGPTPVDGDVVEYIDPTNEILVHQPGNYEIVPGGPFYFLARRWSNTTEMWGDWVTITVDSNPFAGLVGGLTTPFNGNFSITVSSVLAACSASQGGTLSLTSVTPGANCATAVINGANIDISPSVNIAGTLEVSFDILESPSALTNTGTIRATIEAIDPTQSHDYIFSSTSNIQLTLTRGSNGLNNVDNKSITVA